MLSTLYVPKTNNNYSMPGSMQPQKDNPFLFWVKEVMYFFLEDYRGTVIINRIKGIEIHDEPDAWYLHVGAGENWHRLVKYTLQEGMPGLENLALIPRLCRLITYPEYWCLWRRITASLRLC